MARLDLTATTDGASALLGHVRAGADVLLIGPPERGRAALDSAAEALAGECRTLRVRAEPGLSLSGLMAQVAGEEDFTAHDDAVVELGYRRLAVPDAPGQRVMLLVSDADQLQRPALRFIQHIARTAPPLLLVLAGGRGLDVLLDSADFASLRERLPTSGAGDPAFARERVSSVSQRTRRLPVAAGVAGLGLAAGVVLAAWAVRVPFRPTESALMQIPRLASPAVPATQPPVVAATLAPVPVPVASPAAAAAAKPEPMPTQQAALLLPAPQAPRAAVEPERAPPPRVVKAPEPRASRSLVRRAKASHSGARGPDDDRGPWIEEAAGPSYGRPPPYWGPPAEAEWDPPPPPPRAFIGTFAADGQGVRSFRYEEGW